MVEEQPEAEVVVLKRTLGSLEAEVLKLKDQKGEEAEVEEAEEETEREEGEGATRFGENQKRLLRQKRKLRSLKL